MLGSERHTDMCMCVRARAHKDPLWMDFSSNAGMLGYYFTVSRRCLTVTLQQIHRAK